MTRATLPWFVVSLIHGALGSCMGSEGTYQPVLHPSYLEWIEYIPARGPMTRDALLWFVVSLERDVKGSCMGLEGTCGPVLHPSPPRILGIFPRLGTNDKGHAPIVRFPLGMWCVRVLHGARGHMWAHAVN